jgi:hypothetical protein
LLLGSRHVTQDNDGLEIPSNRGSGALFAPNFGKSGDAIRQDCIQARDITRRILTADEFSGVRIQRDSSRIPYRPPVQKQSLGIARGNVSRFIRSELIECGCGRIKIALLNRCGRITRSWCNDKIAGKTR